MNKPSQIDRVFLDMDGVIVNYVDGVCRLHNRPNPYVDGSYKGYHVDKFWLITVRDFYAPQGREFWANLNWMPDGREIFEFLHNMFGPDHIVLLSSPILTDGCIDGKIDWIKKNLPKEYHRQYLIGPPKHFCASKRHLLIDDREENIDLFMQSGGNAFLVGRPWNKFKKGFMGSVVNEMNSIFGFNKEKYNHE